MTSVTMRYVFKLRFVLLGVKTVFIGYYELFNSAIDGSNSFVGAYFLFIVWLLRVLIGSLKGSLVTITRKRLTIYKPHLRLEDRRVNVSRSQNLFAFSAHSHALSRLTNSLTRACAATTRICRNSFEETLRTGIESI